MRPAAADAGLVISPASASSQELPRELRRLLQPHASSASSGRWCCISDPAAVKALYSRAARTACRRAATSSSSRSSAPRSLLLLEGADHLAHRKLMLPALPRRADALLRADGRGDRRRRDRLLAARRRASPSIPAMQAVTLEVILRVVFGVADGPPPRAACAGLLASLLAETGSSSTQLRALATRRFGGRIDVWSSFEGRLARDRRAALRRDRRAPRQRATSRSATTSSRLLILGPLRGRARG